LIGFIGTTEVVPFYKAIGSEFFNGLPDVSSVRSAGGTISLQDVMLEFINLPAAALLGIEQT